MNPTPLILRFVENEQAKKHIANLIDKALKLAYTQGKQDERNEIVKEYAKLKN